MTLIYSNALISNTLFIDNIAKAINNGISLVGSTLNSRNITVTYTNKDFLNNLGTNVDAGFFSLSFSSIFTLTQSLIENCRGSTASVLYGTGTSSVVFDGQN